MRFTSLALALIIVLGCSGASVARPSVELPNVDTAALQRLVDDAIAEVDRLAATTSIELPPDLAALLGANNIALPALPSNANDICQSLGTPGVSTVAGAGLSTLIETLATGTEVGLVVGLLVTVVFRTCPIWMPHLETSIEHLL